VPPKWLPSPPLRPNPGPYNHRQVGLPVSNRMMYLELYRASIKINDIAEAIGISRVTAFRWQKNLQRYASIKAPGSVPRGRPFWLSIDNQLALFEELCESG
jgi:transposase